MYVVVRIDLYYWFVLAFYHVRACSGVPGQGFAFRTAVVGYHRDTGPIIIFSLIN